MREHDTNPTYSTVYAVYTIIWDNAVYSNPKVKCGGTEIIETYLVCVFYLTAACYMFQGYKQSSV